MFWTDWGNSAHIGVAFMDGSEPKTLVDDVIWPNGLALDWPNGRIYWVDAKHRTIESATITGADRRKVLEGFVQHPFGLAVFEDRLYWSDWDTMSIDSCDKFTGKNHDVLVQGEQIFGKLRLDLHPVLMLVMLNIIDHSRCSHLSPINDAITKACLHVQHVFPHLSLIIQLNLHL